MLAGAAGSGDGAARRGTTTAMSPDGGRVADGPRLSPYVRARIAEARVTPPAFASLRNLAQTTTAQLTREPMPEGLVDSQPAEPPGKKRGGRERPRLPRDAQPTARDDTPRPTGPIAIADLYLPGVYADK
eukprot:4587526-Pleurochrysis_carterae.AAC.1